MLRFATLLVVATLVAATIVVSAHRLEQPSLKKPAGLVLSTKKHPDSKTNDYFILSVQKCDRDSNYTMHGLWPQSGKYGPYPSNCRDVTFSESAIQDLMPEMTRYWFSCPGMSSNREFWTHEWEKHGSCVPASWQNVGPSLEHTYFQAGLNVFLAGQWQSSCNSWEKECKVHVFPQP